jgi:hypothetical protein
MGQFIDAETEIFRQFLVSIGFFRLQKSGQKKKFKFFVNMLWIMSEFNRNKKNPFEQKLAHIKVFWIQKLT